MAVKELPVVFNCDGQRLLGMVHGAGCGSTGVLVIVGGPQYRVGSHRQFLLLARHLAANNVPVMRFDYRGMGDSEGEIRSFEDVGDDIRAAIDTFIESSPGLDSVVLWGLCDAASAALFYAHTDSRVTGMVLLNPWCHTEAGEAKAYLSNYYFGHLFSKALWQKVFSGKFEFKKSISSLFDTVNKSRADQMCGTGNEVADDSGRCVSLPERMYQGGGAFQGWLGIVISGNDLTAAEFEHMLKSSAEWQKLLTEKEVMFHYLPEANHTFSRQVWRDEVAEQTLRWIKSAPQ